jgi:tight adherence protein B
VRALGVVIAVAGAYGVFLLFTALAYGWSGVGIGPSLRTERVRRRRGREWLVQAGLGDVRPADLAAATGLLAVVSGGLAWALFGGRIAPLVSGALAAGAPLAGARARRSRRREQAREAWPRLIEEIRLQATTMGRSIPQALFVVGARAPDELRPAFAAAHREWLLSTDFARTVAVLKTQLADATADAVCETLLVAHEIGGSDLEQRLSALTEDRLADLQGRQDAVAKQAGARFARRFVLLVPVGMALAGLAIGNGRAAYQTPLGQALVGAGLVLVAVCWVWAGRIMRLPAEDRVFFEEPA